MSIAGRCFCGVLLSLVAVDPQPHRYCAPDGQRRCRGCHRALPLSDFWPDRVNGRHQSLCKSCHMTAARKSYARRYWSDPEFREQERARRRKATYGQRVGA